MDFVSEVKKEKKPITKRVTGTTREVAAQILNLATSSLGLVAALAWNDAVQSIFRQYFPAGNGVAAKLIYAIIVSVLIVIITINLTKLSQLAKNK